MGAMLLSQVSRVPRQWLCAGSFPQGLLDCDQVQADGRPKGRQVAVVVEQAQGFDLLDAVEPCLLQEVGHDVEIQSDLVKVETVNLPAEKDAHQVVTLGAIELGIDEVAAQDVHVRHGYVEPRSGCQYPVYSF